MMKARQGSGHRRKARRLRVCLMTILCAIGLLPAMARAQDTATTPGVRLGLNYAAYESEIYRSALLAVPVMVIGVIASVSLNSRKTQK